MSDLRRDDQRRQNKERDRQVYYFATLKVIAETLNNGVSLRQTLASTLPLVIELLQLHTGWLFLRDEQLESLLPSLAGGDRFDALVAGYLAGYFSAKDA